MLKQKKIDFEVNLTKMKWCPKHVSEIPKVISRAFERDITMGMIQPIIGTDHVKQWVLKEDKDIPEFFNAPNMMQEWIAEKLIKVRIPDGIIPKDFQPKKVKILATGQKIAKFFGEDPVSSRVVECTLKLFDCRHFYLKQTLPGSGASPHWMIFEGRWAPTERGLRLTFLIRYSWQLNRKPPMDFSVEATREDSVTSLAWEGETEKQLNGNIPAIVGTEDFYWAELVQEGSVSMAHLRWNEDDEESTTSCPGATPTPDLPTPEALTGKRSEQSRRSASRPDDCNAPSRAPAEAKTPVTFAVHPGLKKPEARPSDSTQMAGSQRLKAAGGGVLLIEDTESPWPLYIGLGIFVLMSSFVFFSYANQ